MKISKLIENLSQYDGDLEVLLEDKILGTVVDIRDAELIHTYDKDFVLLSLNYKDTGDVILGE